LISSVITGKGDACMLASDTSPCSEREAIAAQAP
jgi:hypothetical protein